MHGLGFEVLAHDVGRGNQAQHHFAPLGAVQVNRQALFVAVEQRIKPGAAAQQAAGTVTGEWLDLDDLGAQIAQRHAAGRAHDHVGEFNDADAGQGKRFVRFGSAHSAAKSLRDGSGERPHGAKSVHFQPGTARTARFAHRFYE